MRTMGVVRTLTVSTAATQLLGPSEQRVAILFSPPLSGTYTVSTDSGVANGSGLNLLATSSPLLITRELFGDAVNRAWFGIGPGPGSLTIGIIETVTDG